MSNAESEWPEFDREYFQSLNEETNRRILQKMTESNNYVRLRGLPFTATEEDVKEFLGADIEVENVHFTTNHDGRPSGECYVGVPSDEQVRLALEKHQQNMGSRYVEVFTVGDVEMDTVRRRFMKNSAVQSGTTVRIRGLPFSCKKEDLQFFFKKLTVVEAVFGKEPGEWGRPTGEAYIRFGSAEETERAMELNGQYLGKRYLELFNVDVDAFEHFKEKMERGGNRPRPLNSLGDDRWGGGSNYYPPAPAPYGYDPYSYGRNGPPHGGGGHGGGGYGRGPAPPLHDPYSYGPPQGGYGGGRGGYDDYPPPRHGGHGGGHHGGHADGGYAPNPYADHHRGHGSGGYGSHASGGGSGHYNSAGELITPCKVHMRGLPYRIGYHDIMQFFAPITPLEIKVGVFDDGRASGDGIVEFANEMDARDALIKDRDTIRNRYIELFPHDQMKIPPATTYKSIYKNGGGVGPGGPPPPPQGYAGSGASWRY